MERFASLLDGTIFTVSSEAYSAFLARLNELPKPNDGLRRTMQTTPPWECKSAPKWPPLTAFDTLILSRKFRSG